MKLSTTGFAILGYIFWLTSHESLYLTGFLKCRFPGENAKNRNFCGKIKRAAVPFTIFTLTIS
jgi:hypothetical protein